MAKSISYLSPGTKIIDSMGNTYIVIAQNHYKDGQTTVQIKTNQRLRGSL